MTSPPTQETIERLLPVLVQIQARLGEDLSLPSLAARAGLSPTHFHRLFSQLTQETPKQYCQRLRLERAAFELLMYHNTIQETALACGFTNHETFTRAFKKRFGVTPRDFRAAPPRSRIAEPTALLQASSATFEVSATRPRVLADMRVAFIRHVGPYEEVSASLWERLLEWHYARSNERPALVGICHDAPGLTPDDKLRFDAAISADEHAEASGDIGFQTIDGGIFGVTTHVGHYSTIGPACRIAYDRLAGLRRYRVVGLPLIELYNEARLDFDHALNKTDLCIPLAER